jgi:hypothetical protein
MIRKRVRLERRGPARRRWAKKRDGVADAGDRVHAPALEVSGPDDMAGIEQVVELVAFERHADGVRSAGAARARAMHDARHRRSAQRRGRLAQRPAGSMRPVAEAALARPRPRFSTSRAKA